MEMRDSTVLRGDVFRPDDHGRYPVILTRTPYDKTLRKNNHFLNPIDTVFAGYARVVQDVRGRFASDGVYYLGEHVGIGAQDAYDTVEWIAAQPWCDGNVGMVGTSYEGSLQWPAAMTNPPHLKAIAPDVGPCGPVFEQALNGGPAYLAFLAYWTLQVGGDIADKLEKEGKDVSTMRRMFTRAFEDDREMLNFLPLKDNPYFNFDGVREIWNGIVLNFNPATDLGEYKFWAYDLVKVPVLNVCGWFDISTWSTFKNFTGMKDKGGAEIARKNQHLLMGPWKHGPQSDTYLGDMDFGSHSWVGFNVGPGSPATAHHLMFFDRYLKGIDSKMPALLYFTMGENRWHTAEDWPLPGTHHQKFFLHSRGRANTAAGDGTLTRTEPHPEPPDTYVYNPLDPVPTTGGRHIYFGVMPGPKDQVHVERRSDVLCYTSPELTQGTEVTGEIQLHLFAGTSARDTDFTAQLIDVFPDGKAYNMADGVIRARFRKSIYQSLAELVTPGDVNEYIIKMGITSHLFRKGHRIRIDISSSNFPAWVRNMNTGNPPNEDVTGIPAKQTIYHQPDYASFVDLPVVVRK
jgi:hypothetical protein